MALARNVWCMFVYSDETGWANQPGLVVGQVVCSKLMPSLAGGFNLPGEMIQFDEYFSNGLKPPTRSPFIEDVFLGY